MTLASCIKVSQVFNIYLQLLKLGRGGVQGQGKGLRLMGIKAVNDYSAQWASRWTKVLGNQNPQMRSVSRG